jgi:hypothetical protein
MLEEQAYEYLLAAYIMEVQLRYRRFIYNGFVEEQLKQVANCLTANTGAPDKPCGGLCRC